VQPLSGYTHLMHHTAQQTVSVSSWLLLA